MRRCCEYLIAQLFAENTALTFHGFFRCMRTGLSAKRGSDLVLSYSSIYLLKADKASRIKDKWVSYVEGGPRGAKGW